MRGLPFTINGLVICLQRKTRESGEDDITDHLFAIQKRNKTTKDDSPLTEAASVFKRCAKILKSFFSEK